MALVLGPFGNPSPEEFLLWRGERFMGLRRGIRSSASAVWMQAISSLASGFPGNKGDLARLSWLQGPFAVIEPKSAFHLGDIGAVTGEAVVGQHGPDVAVEIHLGAATSAAAGSNNPANQRQGFFRVSLTKHRGDGQSSDFDGEDDWNPDGDGPVQDSTNPRKGPESSGPVTAIKAAVAPG